MSNLECCCGQRRGTSRSDTDHGRETVPVSSGLPEVVPDLVVADVVVPRLDHSSFTDIVHHDYIIYLVGVGGSSGRVRLIRHGFFCSTRGCQSLSLSV